MVKIMSAALYHQQISPTIVYFSDLAEMAAAADWMVVSMPSGAGTDKIVSEKVLCALGANGNFVNVARGALVDQQALITRLQSGQLGGAALDVFAAEPSVPAALKAMHNVVLSPHAASATSNARMAMGELVIKNILAYLDAKPLITQVV